MKAKQALTVAVMAGTLVVAFQNCSGKMESSNSAAQSGSGGQVPINSLGPLSPNQLNVTASASTEIDLVWNDNSADEIGFKIERAPYLAPGPFDGGSGSPGTYAQIALVGPNINHYADVSVTAATTYYYRISAAGQFGSSLPSGAMTATSMAAPVTAPAIPSILVAAPTAATIVNLSWIDNSNNESGFAIERSMGNAANFQPIAFTSANQTTFTDINLTPQTNYFYRVRAVNSAGPSAFTANTMVSTLPAGNMATYSYVRVNILETNCVSCHGAMTPAAGISYASYGATLNTVNAGNSANSSLYTSVAQGGNMPLGGHLDSMQINAIKSWIDAGAANN